MPYSKTFTYNVGGVFDNPLYANTYATYVNNTHIPARIFFVYF